MKDGVPTIKPEVVPGLEEVILIDVRTSEEYVGELGHIKGTSLVTIGADLDNFLSSANKKSSIIFICRSGARSGKATSTALELGFEKVYNMEGGMLAWNSLALPTSK